MSIIYIVSSRSYNKLISREMTSDSAFSSFPLAYSRMQTREAPRKAGKSRRHARSWKCGSFRNVVLSHSLKRGCYGRRASLKRNSSDSCTLIRHSGGTHLIVSGSISFKWLEDAWKMLLLLMFMLFSLLHNRIVDISAQFRTALWFSAFLHLSIRDRNPRLLLFGVASNVLIFVHSNFH